MALMLEKTNKDVCFVMENSEVYHLYGQCQNIKMAVYKPHVTELSEVSNEKVVCENCERLEKTAMNPRYPNSFIDRRDD